MNVDPVAVYAAVVATGTLGWEVYSWRSQRKGTLEVIMVARWRDKDNAWLDGRITNANDYAVKLFYISAGTANAPGIMRSTFAKIKIKIKMKFWAAGPFGTNLVDLPSEVPAHDSVGFQWNASTLSSLLGSMPFKPGYVMWITVGNSLNRESSAMATIVRDLGGHFDL